MDPYFSDIVETKFDGDRYLEIDRGRYLAIDNDGEYVISTKPKAVRGTPYGGFEGYEGMRVPIGGGRLGDYRDFAVDRGATVDLVSIGILYVDDECIWVSGDKIRHEDDDEELVEEDGREDYYPILVTSFPKQRPHNMSDKQLWDLVKKQSFDKLCADLKRAGIKVPDESYLYRDVCLSSYDEDNTKKVTSRKRKGIMQICSFGKSHICPLMVSSIAKRRQIIARKKRRNH